MSSIENRVFVPRNQAVYSDISASIRLESRDDVQNMDSIQQKILFIVGTRKRSRKWRPTFGCDVFRLLFEPFDDTTAGWIQTFIKEALESPANGLTQDVTSVNVDVTRRVDSTYRVVVAYRVPKLEQTSVATDQSVSFSMRSLA